MVKLNIDMSDPSKYQKEFVVPEPGIYELTVTNRLKIEPSKSSTNMITKVELTGELEDNTKFVIFDNLVHNENSQWKIYQFLRSLGFTNDEIGEGVDLEDCYQMTLKAKLTQELDNNGDKRARVARYLYDKQ